ncbi:MAG: DMT family transporter [Clostridiales bacterium]|nr:DMT family transporter [Clostridiales bacterium]
MSAKTDGTSKIKLYAVAMMFTFSIGFSFFGIKKCVPYADTLTILAYRYIAALVGVALWLLVCRAIGIKSEKRPGRPRFKLYQTAAFYILFMIFQIFAMFFATSIEGAIVYTMVPIFAKLIGRTALGEKSTPIQNVFVVITVAALMVLVILNATDIHLNFTGLILMTISSIFMACQNVSARYIRGVFKPIEITTCIAVGGSVIFITAAVGRALIQGDIKGFLEPLTHSDFVIWVSFLGTFCILLSAQFMAYMLAHMEIVQSTIFNSASTFVSIIAGALILGEPLYWYHFICGVLILTGVVGLTLAPTDARNSGKSLKDDIRR